MGNTKKIIVQDTTIQVDVNTDYFSLTDMVKAKDGNYYIENWLRNRNTVEFIGIWESINNPDFNSVEFDDIKKQAGLNSFKLSAKEWNAKTNGIGITAKAGRYGGTYAHKDIAFNFGMWISPEFQLYLIKEYQRLKVLVEGENEWNYRRMLAKTNYHIHTDAVKEFIIEPLEFSKQKQSAKYAEEADLLNLALFGMTAKQWKEKYKDESEVCNNIRDCADIIQLVVLSNLEATNALLLEQGKSKIERFELLKMLSEKQNKTLKERSSQFKQIESPNKSKLKDK